MKNVSYMMNFAFHEASSMGMSADGPVGRAESSQTADEAQQHIRKNVTISAGRRSNVESPHLSIFFFFRLGILWALPAFLPYPFGLPQRDQNRKKSQTTP